MEYKKTKSKITNGFYSHSKNIPFQPEVPFFVGDIKIPFMGQNPKSMVEQRVAQSGLILDRFSGPNCHDFHSNDYRLHQMGRTESRLHLYKRIWPRNVGFVCSCSGCYDCYAGNYTMTRIIHSHYQRGP